MQLKLYHIVNVSEENVNVSSVAAKSCLYVFVLSKRRILFIYPGRIHIMCERRSRFVDSYQSFTTSVPLRMQQANICYAMRQLVYIM